MSGFVFLIWRDRPTNKQPGQRISGTLIGPGPDQSPAIGTQYGYVPEPLATAIRKYWPESEWGNAGAISFLESGWRTEATANTLGRVGGQCNQQYHLPDGRPALTEYAVGQWQINLCAHSDISEADARDPDSGTAYAAQLYHANGDTYHQWLYNAQALGLPT